MLLLSSTDFFQNQHLRNILYFYQNVKWFLLALIWVGTVCWGYQHTTKVVAILSSLARKEYKITSEYDKEMPQSQITDQPMALWERTTRTWKKNKEKLHTHHSINTTKHQASDPPPRDDYQARKEDIKSKIWAKHEKLCQRMKWKLNVYLIFCGTKNAYVLVILPLKLRVFLDLLAYTYVLGLTEKAIW